MTRAGARVKAPPSPLSSSSGERSGDRSLVIPDEAKRRSLPCHPRRSEAEIGDGVSPSLATPGQPPWAEPGDSLRPPGQAGTRLNAPARCHTFASPPPGSRLSPSGCPGGVRGEARRPRSPLRFVGDDKESDLRCASSGMTRRAGTIPCHQVSGWVGQGALPASRAGYRSVQRGLASSIRANFHGLSQRLIRFSLRMA